MLAFLQLRSLSCIGCGWKVAWPTRLRVQGPGRAKDAQKRRCGSGAYEIL